MNTNRIAAGMKFRVILGSPRECVITKVTSARVYFNSIREGEEARFEFMPRAMIGNAAMVEVSE
jgi:hypothetical protein